MVGFNRGSTFPSRSSSSRLPLAGMQMTIVLTLGLEDPHTITRGIPWQTKKQPGSMTLTSHHRRVYTAGAHVTTWVQHCSLIVSAITYPLSRYSYLDILVILVIFAVVSEVNSIVLC